MKIKRKPKIQIDESYLGEYRKNEQSANKQMTYALSFTAILMLIIWVLYLIPGIFRVTTTTRIVTAIALPVFILVLISPQFWVRREAGSKPGFKYFLLVSFITVITLLNTLIPKHVILGWALCIVLANHYYNMKLGRIVFGVTLLGMLIGIYCALFLGEYDPNLLMGEMDDTTGLIHSYVDPNITFPDTPQGRAQYLSFLLSKGYNRYFAVFVYYYLPRALILLITFFTSNTLNRRTYTLMVRGIQINTEQQKMNSELEIAKSIQLETLPGEIVTGKEVRIVAELIAAKEIGGDFYDYFNVDDDHVAIVIGDVSGKGIPAAMFMMKTITCFKNFMAPGKLPSQILREVNSAIYDGNESQMFVTCFLGILDKRTGLLKFSNAGHNPPVVGKVGHFHFLECNPGFILGGMEECYCVDEEITLDHGESITLYTDGVTEARNIDGDLFGEDRLIQACNKKNYYSLIEMNHEIKDEVGRFVKTAPQSDDMTIMTLLYHGDDFDFDEKEFDAKMEMVPEMLDFIRDFCEKENINREFKNSLQVVGDELFSNIIKHGYAGEEGFIYIRLLYNLDKNELVFTIVDKAPKFNQLEVNNDPIDPLNVENQKVGGLGILIVKKIMTECVYDRINKKNILVLRKKF